MGRIWGIDVSDWNDPNAIDFRYLKDNGCRFVIVKSSMGGGLSRRLVAHADAVRKANLHLLIYHWADPTVSIPRQLDYLDQAVKLVRPEGIAIDIEQWWANWNEFHEYLSGKRKQSEVRIIPKSSLNSFYYRIMIETSLRFPNITRNNILYTSRWFWTQYVPGMESWISRYPLWIAYYPIKSLRFMSWDRFDQFIQTSNYPIKTIQWKLWQVCDNHILLPRMKFGLDVDIFNGSYDDFVEWLDTDTYHEAIESDVPIRMVVVTARIGLRVREAPNGRDTGKRLKYGDKVKIYEEEPAGGHVWGKIGDREWIALTYTRPFEV